MYLASQASMVVAAIQRMIAVGEVSPGDRLPIEADLTERFGVSRGSLREGLRALVAMGVLETRQGSGTTVTSLEPALLLGSLGFWSQIQSGSAVVEILVTLRGLEVEAVGQAAPSLSPADLDRLAALATAAQTEVAGTSSGSSGRAGVDLLGQRPLAGWGSGSPVENPDQQFHQLIAEASGNRVLAALIDALAGHRDCRGTTPAQAECARADHHAVICALRAGDVTAARAAMYLHLSRLVQDLSDSDPA